MDLPPRFRRHPRYGNVPYPPRFVHHHLTPLAPPLPLPPSPPRILLPPLLPPRHDGQLPFPTHYSAPPYLPILERSYLQEFDPLRKPYLDLYHPPHQVNSPFRIIHHYSLRDSIIENEIFRRGCNNNYAFDFPRAWDRELPCGATEGSSTITEMEDRRCSNSRVSDIEARDTWNVTNADARRWDNGSRELYFEREDDVRRRDCGVNGPRELCFGRNIDSRRWECAMSRGRELSLDRVDSRIRLDFGTDDGISLQLENRQQEFSESNLGLHRFSGRLGREGSKREFHRSRKMNRVQKNSALHRIQLGKARKRRIRGKRVLKNLSSSSLRGRGNENFECLETLATDNQETEQSPVDLSISFKSNSLVAKAILVASSPVSKEDICLSSRNQKIRNINNMVDTGSANSSEVVKEQMPGFQSGMPRPQIELLEKFNVSGNEKTTAYKVNSSGDNFVENEVSKDRHLHGLDNFRSGSRMGFRSKKKRRRRNKNLHGTRLQLSEDSGEIVNFETSISGINFSNKSGGIEGTFESKIKRKRKRKRKSRGTQMGISGSNATVPLDKGSSVDDELANFLATDVSSVKEADFPGVEDNSFRLKEGPSVDQDSHLDAVDFSGDGSFPGNIKKRKVVSPRLNFSSCLVDDSIGDCLASDDLKVDQVSLRPAEQDADQSKETLSAVYMANTDGSENFSIPEMDGTLAYGNNNLHLKDDLAFICNTLSICADGSDDCATQSGDELVAPGFDTPSCISSPEDLLSHTDFHSESEIIFEGFQTSKLKLVSGRSTTLSLRNSIENATLQTNTKVPPSLSQKIDKVLSSESKPTSAAPNTFSGHPAFNFHTSKKFPSTHFAKSRTWHRTDQSSINVTGPTLRPCPLPQNHVLKASRISQSSYVRKGNSLVRKSSSSGGTAAHTPSSSGHPTSPCMDYLKNSQVKADTPCIPRIGQVNRSESSRSLPLNHTGRSLRTASCHLVESLPVTNSLGNAGPAKTLDALKETAKSFEIPECQAGSGNNSDGPSTLGKENLGKNILYVKRRSNQLVATSDPKDSSTSGLDKSQPSLSDGYYKNSKNQLIRVSSESQARKGDSMATLNSYRLGSQTILPTSSGKRQSSKGFAKTSKLSKFSSVWNLNGAQLPDKSSSSLGPHKLWPYLFPLRRATYRRSSLPSISQKLLLSSKRGAIYTRSTHGYSLRISKVLSVCGRSLKWSKSIERNSKKANEEATRAVAAAEKRKKEEKGVTSVLSKSRNHVSRERIFRIGSERYKMDPSRRSLYRITEEEEPSPSDVLQFEKNLKKSYLPKRLLIGNDEYVRIGTGNQLVRDPKKRTRVLASEKVRWSLRTARLRLARKRKYCQFFTRFGRCNKSDGKCPYIHDPSKIVVCTKFLNGSCTDSDCKLTHKVIPERMPDCSYFLKGSCSNENCPYRHVNVNPKSSICKRFLRGYCADGNECRKKHTYVCPAFESTGICPQSSICKLHHPKKKTENEPVIEQKIARGRYFDGGLIDVAERSMATGEKLSAKGEDDIICEEGKYPDYISLDISDDDPEMSVL